MIGFVNTRTGARTSNLSGYPTEKEAEAVARLKAAGWDMMPGSYVFDEQTMRFEYNTDEVKSEKEEETGEAAADADSKPE